MAAHGAAFSALLLCAGSPGPGRAPGGPRSVEPQPPSKLVEVIDRSFQERFQRLDPPFGFRRVTTTPEHDGLSYWRPESFEERQAAAGLRRRNWEGLFLVAGRTRSSHFAQIATTRGAASQPGVPGTNAANAALFPDRSVSEPILLTAGASSQPPPAEDALLHALARMWQEPRPAPREFRSDRWWVFARPIRAGKPECVSCHNARSGGPPLHLGDAVGVALYALALRRPPVFSRGWSLGAAPGPHAAATVGDAGDG